MKTIKVTGPHVMFSPVSSFYSELQELATRDSTNRISARDKHFTLPNGSRVEVKLYNKVYKHGDYSVAYLDGESSFNMSDLTGWSAAHEDANVYDAPSFIRLTQDEYNDSLVPSGVYSYQKEVLFFLSYHLTSPLPSLLLALSTSSVNSFQLLPCFIRASLLRYSFSFSASFFAKSE